MQELDGDRLVEGQVACAHDEPHRSFADRLLDAVVITDDGIHVEASRELRVAGDGHAEALIYCRNSG
jgi:hypothetical protein